MKDTPRLLNYLLSLAALSLFGCTPANIEETALENTIVIESLILGPIDWDDDLVRSEAYILEAPELLQGTLEDEGLVILPIGSLDLQVNEEGYEQAYVRIILDPISIEDFLLTLEFLKPGTETIEENYIDDGGSYFFTSDDESYGIRDIQIIEMTTKDQELGEISANFQEGPVESSEFTVDFEEDDACTWDFEASVEKCRSFKESSFFGEVMEFPTVLGPLDEEHVLWEYEDDFIMGWFVENEGNWFHTEIEGEPRNLFTVESREKVEVYSFEDETATLLFEADAEEFLMNYNQFYGEGESRTGYLHTEVIDWYDAETGLITQVFQSLLDLTEQVWIAQTGGDGGNTDGCKWEKIITREDRLYHFKVYEEANCDGDHLAGIYLNDEHIPNESFDQGFSKDSWGSPSPLGVHQFLSPDLKQIVVRIEDPEAKEYWLLWDLENGAPTLYRFESPTGGDPLILKDQIDWEKTENGWELVKEYESFSLVDTN